jgi:hypothetical protein
MRLLGFSAPLPRRHRFLGRAAGDGAISVQPASVKCLGAYFALEETAMLMLFNPVLRLFRDLASNVPNTAAQNNR